MVKSRIYNIWCNAKSRCTNPNNPRFKNYGGRGIKMCNEWMNDSNCFILWANKNGYSKDFTIDRIDVNGDYCPENCRWISNKEQQNNRRNNVSFSIGQITMTLTEWCERYSIGFNTVKKRLKKGMEIYDALTMLIHKRRIDLSGMKFGRLTVVSFAFYNGGTYWNCKCDCGKTKVVRGDSLKNKSIVSCGCYHSEIVKKL